jgi:2,3-bisphosphoglycerate-independent phosphoglycerate mutase
MENRRQVALIILDGWGYSETKTNNAVWEAATPFFDELWQKYSPTLLEASGEVIGLPEGQMGNSEVCHLTIGAGKTVYSDLLRISQAIKDGSFFNNPVILKAVDHVKKNKSKLHLLGLLGPGGVHSHSDHLLALLKLAKEKELDQVYLHLFLDGRDTPPQSASLFAKNLEAEIEQLGIGKIATAGGRYFGMDRDNNWDRLSKAQAAIFEGQGVRIKDKKLSEVLSDRYQQGENDEFIETLVFEDLGGTNTVQENDALIFFNFRPDRARMLSSKILEQQEIKNWFFATLTTYDANFACPVIFPKIKINTCLAKEISLAGLSQVHIAETEKFAHATYFLNGGVQEPFAGETDILIESRKDIKTHDEAPEMKAEEIADKAIEEIKKGTDFIFVNFANPDMIGHTGNVTAIKIALTFVDQQLERVIRALDEVGGVAFITADHGNAEVNIDPETGIVHTAHTTSLVPAIITDEQIEFLQGTLVDVAPTVLSLLELTKPSEMTGKNLIILR